MSRTHLLMLASVLAGCAGSAEPTSTLGLESATRAHDAWLDSDEAARVDGMNATPSTDALVDVLGPHIKSQDCELMGVLRGQWPDTTLKLEVDVLDLTGAPIAHIGRRSHVAHIESDAGTLYAMDNGPDGAIQLLDGDWWGTQFEADLWLDAAEGRALEVFGVMSTSELGGALLGGIFSCE